MKIPSSPRRWRPNEPRAEIMEGASMRSLRDTARDERSLPRSCPLGGYAAARAEDDSSRLPRGRVFEPTSGPQEPRLVSIDGRGRPDRNTEGEDHQNPDLRTADRPRRPSGRAAGYCLEGP